MKPRYISGFHDKNIKKKYCDVVVIGTGVAGLFTALNIDHKYRVIIISKTELDENNSNLAQGGIAACIDDQDDFQSHYEDTIRAGAYYNREEATKILIEEAPKNIEKLLAYGTNLDRDEKGRLKATREGGHSKRRVLHAKDATGREIIRALAKEVRGRGNIDIQENVFAIDIITNQNAICGVLALDEKEQKVIYRTKAVVLATGGVGQVYKNTTNPSVTTGDGIAMAYRAGANIKDMEFIQFHPTAMYDKEYGQKFLISEAVRGEGAILRNADGEAFMKKYHKMADLAPRDIVARSIFIEKVKTGKPYVYLDITHKDAEFIKNRFPTIYKKCLEKGIDMTKEYIPVSPVQHYIMGGIYTDTNGKTNIKGLYACGECACTGVHGANRLASNSLLEGIVFGNRVVTALNDYVAKAVIRALPMLPMIKYENKYEKINLYKVKERLQDIMDEYVSIVRNEKGLKYALKEVEKMYQALLRDKISVKYYECINMCIVGMLIIKAALKRKESLGAHYRVDTEGQGCIINF
ncbi:L-aspartate oxidase [Crassaminicella thermophila]|uniref:L-aspartate oxidase n=1 Tax=Crassaminicella thermophila TaxID=2599308 RepID=A0A5C0SAE8_CRATE|nr:L-aspartate oxidase [Crassaminicella thermophila]QEK10912.1 L-aspartate oxidase [Crassaminicella thermophila]